MKRGEASRKGHCSIEITMSHRRSCYPANYVNRSSRSRISFSSLTKFSRETIVDPGHPGLPVPVEPSYRRVYSRTRSSRCICSSLAHQRRPCESVVAYARRKDSFSVIPLSFPPLLSPPTSARRVVHLEITVRACMRNTRFENAHASLCVSTRSREPPLTTARAPLL